MVPSCLSDGIVDQVFGMIFKVRLQENSVFSDCVDDCCLAHPSFRLTAFCARIFHEANFNEWEFFLYIDPKVIVNAIDWLLNYQTSYGAFYETTDFPYDRKMNLSVMVATC